MRLNLRLLQCLGEDISTLRSWPLQKKNLLSRRLPPQHLIAMEKAFDSGDHPLMFSRVIQIAGNDRAVPQIPGVVDFF